MTDVEKQQFQLMQKDIKAIEETLKEVKRALVGDDIAKDGGLVKRINELEDELEKLKLSFIKNDIYLRWIWALAGFAGSALFSYVLKLVFK